MYATEFQVYGRHEFGEKSIPYLSILRVKESWKFVQTLKSQRASFDIANTEIKVRAGHIPKQIPSDVRK